MHCTINGFSAHLVSFFADFLTGDDIDGDPEDWRDREDDSEIGQKSGR
jgi:hypothetical protein